MNEKLFGRKLMKEIVIEEKKESKM
jgi:hypothetical protein